MHLGGEFLKALLAIAAFIVRGSVVGAIAMLAALKASKNPAANSAGGGRAQDGQRGSNNEHSHSSPVIARQEPPL